LGLKLSNKHSEAAKKGAEMIKLQPWL